VICEICGCITSVPLCLCGCLDSVTIPGLREEDIRPRDLFNRYLALADRDIERFFRDAVRFQRVDCPACGDPRGQDAFIKRGFEYVTCAACGSLYLSPRPTPDMIERYYLDSEAVRFWSEHFYPTTAEARRARMFRPRAALAAEWATRLGRTGTCGDIGAGYGLFLDEARDTGAFGRVIGIEPNARLAASCRARGFEIVELPVERATDEAPQLDLAVNFEVLEHVSDPLAFLTAIRGLLTPGGALVLTTLTCSGFDIQVLWERSKSVHPPHHINLLSLDGLRRLFDRAGFEVLELATPGELDVDIVRNLADEEPGLPLPRFVRTLIEADDDTRAAYQRVLHDQRLSSHVRVVARRPVDGEASA